MRAIQRSVLWRAITALLFVGSMLAACDKRASTKSNATTSGTASAPPGREASARTTVRGCPPPLPYDGMCAEVVVWVKDETTGACCEYSNPCVAPRGPQFTDRECTRSK